MFDRQRQRGGAAAIVATGMLAAAWPRVSRGAPPTKDECLEAHSRGQDVRAKGNLAQAKDLFLVCSQNSCPALIQSDCARFEEEVQRLVPSVTFAARDARQNDLPDTRVFVDDVQVATRLDDGKAYDVDPGKHVVRFAHDGKEETVTVVVNQGEKGRAVVAVFSSIGATSTSSAPLAGTAGPSEGDRTPHRSAVPLVVAGLGAGAMIVGGVLIVAGLGKVPSSCSVSTKECAAPPGSAAFDDAKHGVALADTGAVVGSLGAVAAIGGLVWYFTSTPRTETSTARITTPWVTHDGAGLAISGRF